MVPGTAGRVGQIAYPAQTVVQHPTASYPDLSHTTHCFYIKHNARLVFTLVDEYSALFCLWLFSGTVLIFIYICEFWAKGGFGDWGIGDGVSADKTGMCSIQEVGFDDFS